jgi:hypothetical protein
MKLQRNRIKSSLFAAVTAALVFAATPASAHCDGVDGPVVIAARHALDTGDVNKVLVWVKPADEEAIREAFGKVREVRKLGAAARELADHSFYETLVRTHRAGEGEPYTGLKPAGRDLGPALPVADKAVETGSVKPVLNLLGNAVHRGVEKRYNEMISLRNFKPDDVAAGQKYIQAYVEYIHAVEKIHEAAAGGGHGATALSGVHGH